MGCTEAVTDRHVAKPATRDDDILLAELLRTSKALSLRALAKQSLKYPIHVIMRCCEALIDRHGIKIVTGDCC